MLQDYSEQKLTRLKLTQMINILGGSNNNDYDEDFLKNMASYYDHYKTFIMNDNDNEPAVTIDASFFNYEENSDTNNIEDNIFIKPVSKHKKKHIKKKKF